MRTLPPSLLVPLLITLALPGAAAGQEAQPTRAPATDPSAQAADAPPAQPEAAAPARDEAASPAQPGAAAQASLPVRQQRRFMVGAELGWNSLAGLGLNGSFHILPRLSADAGLGVASTGLKLGVRARVNVLTSEWTPFVAAGFLFGTGTGRGESTLAGDDPVTFRVRPSPYVQLVAGVDFTEPGGFTFLATLGYAVLLRDNVEVISGEPSPVTAQAFRLAFGSGISAGLTLGYSF